MRELGHTRLVALFEIGFGVAFKIPLGYDVRQVFAVCVPIAACVFSRRAQPVLGLALALLTGRHIFELLALSGVECLQLHAGTELLFLFVFLVVTLQLLEKVQSFFFDCFN